MNPIIFHKSQPVEYGGHEMTDQHIQVLTGMLIGISIIFLFVAFVRFFKWLIAEEDNDWAEFIFFPNLVVGIFNIFVVLVWLFAGIISIVEYSIPIR